MHVPGTLAVPRLTVQRAVALGVMLLVTAAAAYSQATFEYNVQPRTFRACRLLLPYYDGSAWVAPNSSNRTALDYQRSMLFEGMRRYPGKPAGWDVDNPLAPTAITSTMAPADRLLKNTPGYWEVQLDADPATTRAAATPASVYTGPDLSKFDLIYIWAGGKDANNKDVTINLDLACWRAALLKAVHEGAVLWVDQKRDGNGTVISSFAPPGDVELPGAGPATPFSFGVGIYPPPAGGVRMCSGDGSGFYNARDRLLSYPFLLQNARDVQYLGMFPNQINIDGYPWNSSYSPPAAQLPSLPATSATLDTIDVNAAFGLNDSSLRRVVDVWNGSRWLPNIAVARYGAGAIVVSAGDVGYDAVNWWLGAHRHQPLQQEAADCKFAWNVAALAGNFQQSQGGGTASGASDTVAPPPLEIGWQYPDRYETTKIGPVLSAPVYANGMVYALSLPLPGDPTPQAKLMCFDADPARDLDGDGQADDGIDINGDGVNDYIDYSTGRSYDMIWSRNLAVGLTPHTAGVCAATMQLAGGQQRDVVLISLVPGNPGNGSVGLVLAFDARTGAPVWSKQLTPYDSSAGSKGQVIDLSTPVVFKDYVYVLASEYDTNASATAGPEQAYGRAHAFSLNYLWNNNVDNAGPKWSYPQATGNPNGDTDTAPPTGAATTDQATPENRKTLPSFQDPYWVTASVPPGSNVGYNPRPTIPPFPTPRPVVTQPTGPLANSGVNVVLQCTTPYSFAWDTATKTVNIATDAGGSDFTLIPTPESSAASDVRDQLNKYYYRLWLPQGTAATPPTLSSSIVTRPDSIDSGTHLPTINANARAALWTDPADGRIYVTFASGQARELLLASTGGTVNYGITNPLQLAQGVGLKIPYVVGSTTYEANAKLPGPIAQWVRLPVNQRRVASWSVSGANGLSATDIVQDNAGVLRNFDYATAYGGGAGTITSANVDTGVVNWRYRSNRALPPEGLARAQLAKGGAAIERSNGTGFMAVTDAVSPDAGNDRAQVPQILGFNLDPQLRVQLGGAADTQIRPGAALTITTIGADGTSEVTIPATVYDATARETRPVYVVEPSTRTITFMPAQAGWVDDTVGALWGKPIWVTYTLTSATEPEDPSKDTTPPTAAVTKQLHVLPDILRFQYTPGIIRLHHGVVRSGDAYAPSFALPNGTPLIRTAPSLDETPFNAQLNGLPAAWGQFLPRGLLDVRCDVAHPVLTLSGGEPVLPGTDIVVTYQYYDEVTGQIVTANERHQVPVNFGVSNASPVLADRTLHLGTEGYLPTGVRGAGNWLQSPDPNVSYGRRSLLSVLFDPVTNEAHGCLSQVAIPERVTYATNGTPVVNATAAIDSGGILVGSHLMTRLNQVSSIPPGYQSEGAGFVSRMNPERTLICDNTRLVETTGQKPTWVCMGSMAPAYHEALDVDTLGNQELKVTPFARPAKAIYLSDGNILVADSGADRVVEIDRTGRQLWPLDVQSYDFYTSNANAKLSLDHPSDCFRYYVTKTVADGVTTTYTSTHGSLLPGTEAHTVIADAGNERVIDVVTWVDTRGVQTHRVDLLTPATIRLATQTGAARLSYTRAQPIFDPVTNQVDGYLCVAANLHQLVVLEAGSRMVNPPANRMMPSGSGTWAWLAWLYDHVADPANDMRTNSCDNPLIFRNIRDAQLAREGTRVYLTVTAERFDGRLVRQIEIQPGKPIVATLGMNVPPHFLATMGAGVFEYCVDISSASPASWARVPATAGSQLTADDPIWWFTRLNYIYRDPLAASPTRRSLTNLRYRDVDGADHWLEMPWNPVSAIRLPADARPLSNGGRLERHLVTNSTQIVQNLSRDNAHSAASDSLGPASLFSSVIVISTDDGNDNAPANDVHDLDRREVIPDPNDADWSDPFSQPSYADRD